MAIHLNMALGGPPDPTVPLGDEEQADLAATRRFVKEESGYANEQGTKPQTLGAALNDSPAGLLAWIVEKFRTWSDCDGHPENCFTREQMLTNVMLYWATQTSASSARLYWESRHSGASAQPLPFVHAPTWCRPLPQGDPALAAVVGRAPVQRGALGGHGAWWPLRRHGAAGPVRGGSPYIRPHRALTCRTRLMRARAVPPGDPRAEVVSRPGGSTTR